MTKKMILVFVLMLATASFGVSFTRSTTAYLGKTLYDINAPRIEKMYIPSATDGQFRTSEGGAGVTVWPQGVYDEIMYGVGSNGYLYSSEDGYTWTAINTSPTINGLHVMANGGLIAVKNSAGSSTKIYKASVATGELVFDGNEIDFGATTKATVLDWSITSNDNTVLICEYAKVPADVNGGRYIFRSADSGATWDTVVDANDYVAGGVNHWHVVGYHSGSSRFVAFSGDGNTNRLALYSDDDGVTWQQIPNTVTGNFYAQPVALYDDGDPNIMYFADDGYYTSGWINIVTGEYGRHGNIFSDLSSVKTYAWTICKVDDIWYSGGYDDSGSNRYPCIRVSPDGENWTVYHQFAEADNTNGMFHFAGVIPDSNGNDKLHFKAMSSSFQHFVISPAEITEANGIVVMPETSNLFLSIANSTIDTGTSPYNWSTASSLTVARETSTATDIYLGAGALKVTGGDSNPANLDFTSPIVDATNGQTFIGRARLKANTPVDVDITWARRTGASTWTKVSSTTQTARLDKEFRSFETLPFTISSADWNGVRMYFTIKQGSTAAQIFLDNPMIVLAPHRLWVNNDVASPVTAAADRLSYSYNTLSSCSDSFYVKPLSSSANYAGSGNRYIKTWYKDSDNYISLYYSPTDGKFKLQRTIAGDIKTAAESAVAVWQPQNIFKITFTSSSESAAAEIVIGGKTFTVTDSSIGAINNTTITGIVGEPSYVNMFPCTYAEGEFISQGNGEFQRGRRDGARSRY